MAAALVSVALALAAFIWILWPLFEEARTREPVPAGSDAGLALRRSLRELETDLDLGKIRREDLAVIQEHLEKESGA